MVKMTKLTSRQFDKLINSFWVHIRDNWNIYKDNLPQLGHTMMYYNELVYGVRFLPTPEGHYINPKYPILEDLPDIFGNAYTDEIGSLVYDAWPLREEFRPWDGYAEPIEDSVESLMAKMPNYFTTPEFTHEYMYNVIGTGYDWHDGQRKKLGPSGTPEIWYRGYTTAEEFPAQKEFLDKLRNHPRLIEAWRLEAEALERSRIEREERDRRTAELENLVATWTRDDTPTSTPNC